MKKILTSMVLAFVVCSLNLLASNELTATSTKISKVTQLQEKPNVSVAKKVAIFVHNDSGSPELKAKVKSLEFALSARINNMGYSVIDHDLAIRNLNDYLGDPNAKYRSEAETIKKNLQEESLGSKLFAEASGLRIAEFIGADYIISASLSSLGKEKKSFSGYGIKTDNIIYILRSNYSIHEGGLGSGTAGGTVKAEKLVRQTANLHIESDDILNELIDNTADQMAAYLNIQNTSSKIVAKENVKSQIVINCYVESMSFPQIVKKNGNYVITTEVIPATVSSVIAEIDGVTYTLGGAISLSKGIHTIKIKQRDICPVEGTLNVTGEPNQIVTYSLQLTDEARNRWKADMLFIDEMKERAKMSEERRIITEAEAKKIIGISKMYEQSGFKVDSKNLPDTYKTQSMFSN